MSWESLQLWADDEEKRIHECIIRSLRQLISNNIVQSTDDELVISGKLRPIMRRFRHSLKIIWTLHSEASCFLNEDDRKPIGHPDFRFSGNTPNTEQYDYDVECKLVRVKRLGKAWDYCEHYVTDGVQRFQEGKYAQSMPPMGTMIGYLQEGDEALLIQFVNLAATNARLGPISFIDKFVHKDVSRLSQLLQRSNEDLNLYHLWADLR